MKQLPLLGMSELNTMTVFIRIVAAILCGGIVGLERGIKGRAAGFRTHILVCLGSALTMMTGQYIVQVLQMDSDPARIGAQVVSGIGFLGVGTIITTKSSKVKGLTTAAGLWASACLGLTIGIGFFEAAIVGTLGVTIAMITLQKVDRFFYRKSAIRDYYVEMKKVSALRRLMKVMKENGFHVEGIEYERYGNKEGPMGIVLSIRKLEKNNNEDVLTLMGEMEEIIFAEEL